jgi:cephalosporin hydroxylase
MSAIDPKDAAMIAVMAADADLAETSRRFLVDSARYRYTYNFSWMGRPIIQLPADVVALQELVWSIKPGAIVETGIAHGGSLILSASLLHLLNGDGIVVGVDVDIREHNRAAIEAHPLASRIRMIEGSSIDSAIAAQVGELVRERSPVLLILDSNHTHEHVLEELRLYSPLVGAGSSIVVFDTVIEDMPADAFPDRPWSVGNNPKTAVREFLRTNDRFAIDEEIEQKLLITAAPSGYLRCVRD